MKNTLWFSRNFLWKKHTEFLETIYEETLTDFPENTEFMPTHTQIFLNIS